LKELGYGVENVNVSKLYGLTINSQTRKEAEMKAEEMCKMLLANPTKDNFTITIEEKR
jgi:phosphoribosylformylglycinamidine synthase PurS subunit